ncbi:MAG: hypothetical protein M3494_07535 [Actinomycetota bacterium]|nr:hypothetical protein [Rubrobacter sp.]MDQ3507849.1 hypothetical protein [Actinomycetota bacterium]
MAYIDTPEGKLHQYEIYVTEALDDLDRSDTNSLLALTLRDDIEDHLGDFDPPGLGKLRNLDSILAKKHEIVSEVLPNPAETDRRRWWWFLHEGPHVRQERQSA